MGLRMPLGPRLPLASLCGVLALLLGGCAAPPPAHRPGTTLILLPDDDGHVGSAWLDGAQGRQTLSEGFSGTSIAGGAAAPSAPQALGPGAVNTRYAALLAAQPLPSRSFTLYFLHGTAVPTPASRAQLPELLRAVRERRPAVIGIFGHTTAVGEGDFNQQLSLRRAQAVERLVRQDDPDVGPVEVRGLGSTEPLTEAGIGPNDPRNRRVEVQVF